MKSKKTIKAERRWAARAVIDSAYRYLDEHHPCQGKNWEMVDKHPYDREVSTHNHLWHVVVGKKEAREEKREAKAMEQPKMWVIPITSQIPNCATRANKIPLGSRTNNSGLGQHILKP